ncbi:MAG: WG repeat-containing protein [Chitinophagaceae bacterium]|nr:WG repeat-containing protein [Chitinophagaceae bacterium]
MEGKVIVPNIYESIGGFKGSFAITRKNGLAGMINKQGKVLIENKYEKITIGKNNAIKAVKDGQEMMLDIKN